MGRKIRNMFFAVLAMYLISSAAEKVSETDCPDGECTDIDNAECDGEHTKCKCSDGYEEDSTDGSTCVKKRVSETDCPDGDCTGIDNAECDGENTKCKCSDGYEEDSTDGSTCYKILGGTCSGNDECSNVANAVCTGNECTCDTAYIEKDNVCILRAVSETECNNGDECKDIEHAECEKDQTSPKCKCSDGYEEDSTDKNKCVKILGGTCSDNDGCLKVANAVCTGGKCACDTDFGEKDNVCIRSVSGTTCSENGKECDSIDNSHCDTDKCKCDTGYVMNVNECTAESAGAVSDKECTTGDECNGIEHAECDKDATSPKCKCSNGYIEDSMDNNKCVKILGGTCSDDDGCSKVANAVCTGGKCACDTDFGEKDNVCILTVSGTTCSENGDECDDIDNSHCDTDKCKCDAGYVMNVRACVAENAAASIQLGTLTVLLCALATLIQQF